MQSFKSSTSTIRPICIKLVRVLYHLLARKRSFCWQIRDKQNWSITLNYSIQSFFPFRYLLHSLIFSCEQQINQTHNATFFPSIYWYQHQKIRNGNYSYWNGKRYMYVYCVHQITQKCSKYLYLTLQYLVN